MTIEDCESPATEVLVFLLSSLKKKWKWPIGYWFVDKIKSTVQSQLIKMAITECNDYGIKIINVTCDGAYANTSAFKILGCDMDQSYDLIKSDFKINLFDPSIYFTPDACHNVKLARNALGTFGAFKDIDNNLIKWEYIDKLFQLQSEIGFKLGNKLSSTHINWKGNAMKVKLAVQTLSSSVAHSLLYLSQTSIEFENCEATIKFVQVIDEIFDFLNSRNPFAKGFKQAIYVHNIQYLEEKMKNHIEYLYSLKTLTGQHLWKSKRKTFIIGFATAVKSTLAIAKDLLMNHNFKFILTYKFSQDAIELFFGFMRGKFGHNNNPNCLEFKNALKSILLHNSIKMSSGNCTLLSPNEDSIFAIKWNYKKTKEQDEEIDYYLLAEQSNNIFLNSITENVLYYISGFVVKMILPSLKCQYCMRAIIDAPCAQDHSYYNTEDIKSIKRFTNIKQKGGLKLASDSVYKTVRLTETLFKSLIIEKKNLFAENMDQKIMIYVQNELATSSTIFKECNDCWDSTDLFSKPHKIDLINQITRAYLKIRIHAYSKILTSSIAKSVSKRHKLTKTILFYNM